jgi:hypothetical protein
MPRHSKKNTPVELTKAELEELLDLDILEDDTRRTSIITDDDDDDYVEPPIEYWR